MKKRQIIPVCAVLVTALLASAAAAEDEASLQIEVNALLGGKAVLVVDGARHVLATGEVSPEGVELVAVEPEGVRLRIDDETAFFPLGGTRVGGTYARPDKLEERVYRDRNGMFRTPGAINGVPVDFLVDTGASTVAMSTVHAKRLGIDYAREGRPLVLQTASGTANGWQVTLDRVAVGRIKLTNIAAAVIDGDSPSDILLGMSFLNRLDVRQQGSVMILEAQF